MQNRSFWFTAAIALGIAAFTASVLAVALAESLWLDELHTSWTVSAPNSHETAANGWRTIAQRAAAGNQTPLYFWLVGLITQTLGQRPEWLLRVPSVVAWLLAIGCVLVLVYRQAVSCGSSANFFGLSVVSWIVLDRLQWFYATEARPYAVVQLVSLAGWCCVQALVERQCGKQQAGRTSSSMSVIALWCMLSVVNINLHLTAALPVFCQWLFFSGWLCLTAKEAGHLQAEDSPRPPARKLPISVAWTLAAVVVSLGGLPILQFAFPVWQRRGQWSAFANNVSVGSATSMFPIMPVLGCALLGVVVDRLLLRSSSQHCVADHRAQGHARTLWWFAMLGPWLTAWTITAVGIAPMFHRRFIIASALPLVMVGAIELLRVRRAWIRGLAAAGIAVAILFSQGTLSLWRQGYLVGSLRGEDWRAATKWVDARIEPGELLLCAGGLIEANEASLPLSESFAEYLSFPLNGVYRVIDQSGIPVSVTPLIGNAHAWSTQLIEKLDAQAALPDAASPDSVWLIYRGAPKPLTAKLQILIADLNAKQIRMQAATPQKFGNLYVVELQLISYTAPP